MTGTHVFDKSVQKAREWLKNVQDELHIDNEEDAYKATRAVLHSLRDRLPLTETMDLSSQLPLVLIGTYYEGYKPEGKPLKIRDEQEFVEEVSKGLPENRKHEALRYIKGVFKVLEQHVSAGEIKEVENNFPENIRHILRS